MFKLKVSKKQSPITLNQPKACLKIKAIQISGRYRFKFHD